MNAPTDDGRPDGPGLPVGGIANPATTLAGASADGRSGAHAQPIDVPVVPPRPSVADRRRYFLSSLEPSGDFEAVIVAVTDGGRRRYFTTTDGARMTEVDHDWFDHRSSDGGRSLLELDERELGELEAELQFVLPVRGRDPIAETAAVDDAHDDDTEQEIEMTDATESPAPADPAVDARVDAPAEPHADSTDAHDDVDPMTEEFEAMVLESRRSTFVRADSAASAHDPVPTADPMPTADAGPTAGPSTSPVDRLSRSESVEQVALARGIAFIAHRGQLDRNGAPYIDHPGRIAERFDPATEPVEAAAAWLHDVLEDTPVTAEELFEAGILPHVIEVVRLLTRTPDVSADDYYARIRGHEVARRVKLADIDDNTARWRLRRLDYDTQVRLVEKYRVARQALGD